jgi:hypothetical protein
MHIAVVVGTMLLGGWTLNSPDMEEVGGIPENVSEQDLMPSPPTTKMSPYEKMPRRLGPMGRNLDDESSQQNGMPQPNQGASGQSARQRMPIFMPTAPTDNSTDIFGQPNVPTSSATRGRMNSSIPMPPTESSSLGSRADLESKLKSPMTQNRGAASFGNVAQAGSPAGSKAFAGYQPTSGVSPYMNLFRIGGETIDNYTSLVRPQIEQRFLNQQFNRDIRGLDNSTRTQRVDMQQLLRTNQQLQGVATPQYYMNYSNYYPGSGQPQSGP